MQRSMMLRELAGALRTAGSGVTNIESVVAKTSVSAQRVAEEFGGMNGLVLELVEQLIVSMLEPLREAPTRISFETQLLDFASRVADAYAFSHLRGLYRISFLLGRSYWTWTPHGLYRRLLAEEGVKPIDLSQFLVEHFEHVANKNADEALKPILAHGNGPLEAMLLDIGDGLVNSMMSRSALGLYKVAVSESSRFKEVADLYWTLGPKRLIEHIRRVLEEARQRGEVYVADCALAARQFVAMLRGDLHLQIIFGMRLPPTPAEIEAHVKSVVTVFLHGAMEADRLPESFG